jgi:hypothetical protein
MDASNEEKVIASWNLSPDGSIGFSVPETVIEERVLEEGRNLISTDLIFKGFAGDVHAILVSPKNPAAFLVWAPGANNPAAGYLNTCIITLSMELGCSLWMSGEMVVQPPDTR